MILETSAHLHGPFFSVKVGLSYEFFGEVLKSAIDSGLGPGRYPVVNGNGASFHLVLYEDNSWRISTPQLELFPAHTLT